MYIQHSSRRSRRLPLSRPSTHSTWIFKPCWTTFMKKYHVLCVCASTTIQNSYRVCIVFAFIVWLGFNERVADEIKLRARSADRNSVSLDNGNLAALPTNFRINSLLDVLAIKECSTTGVKCGNCDRRSKENRYCFQCCAFWCGECITFHNGMKANKDHYILALEDFQDQDFENILKRPKFYAIQSHEKKEIEFFRNICEVAICHACHGR